MFLLTLCLLNTADNWHQFDTLLLYRLQPTGPPNSGKTSLLKHYCEGRQYQGVAYIDGRLVDATTPSGRLSGGLLVEAPSIRAQGGSPQLQHLMYAVKPVLLWW
jgi:hypothetical protein